MEVKAKAKHIKMSPRKVRLVVDAVRGMKTDKALEQLSFINKLATKPIEKLLKSAIANAENNFELDKDNLFIKEIRVDEGVTLKRWMPRAHGRATPIRKRMSHISLVLGEIKDSGQKEAKKQKIEEPIKIGEQPVQDKNIENKKEEDKEQPVKKENKSEVDIIDPRGEGSGGHTKIEGGKGKGFANKIFRRKAG